MAVGGPRPFIVAAVATSTINGCIGTIAGKPHQARNPRCSSQMTTEVAQKSAIFDALRNRRSMGKVKPERPTREEIEKLLENAVWAPNHHRTQPWKFTVLAGKAREELGQIMAANLRAKIENPDNERAKLALEREAAKPLRAPVLIVVSVSPDRSGKAIEVEEILAGGAATVNILYAAYAMGLSAMWRTGEAAYDDRVKRWLGLAPDDHVISIVYVGYPNMEPPLQERQPATTKTEWRGWE